MPMTCEEIARAPRHPQLMDPAAPEELIEACIWWYPSMFPHRTAVLQHLLLCAGNGYEWGHDGQIRSVFAHLEPDYSTPAERLARGGHDPASGSPVLEDRQRGQIEAEARVRATARDRARRPGPVTISRGSRASDRWGLMATRPQRVHPCWQSLLDEAGQVFTQAWEVQDAAETELRRRWDRNPGGRAAQLLTRQLGRAWAAGDLTDAGLSACDQLLAAWRHPGWPSRLDHDRLRQQRDNNRAQRALVREILARLAAEGQLPAVPETPPAGTGRPQARSPRDILETLAADRLVAVSCLVRRVPFTAWQEWEWALDLVRHQPSAGSPERKVQSSR